MRILNPTPQTKPQALNSKRLNSCPQPDAVTGSSTSNTVASCDMSITVEVGLLSGKTATVKAELDDEVAVGKGRLADESGNVLDVHTLIRDAGVRNGASLTLHIIPLKYNPLQGLLPSVLVMALS